MTKKEDPISTLPTKAPVRLSIALSCDDSGLRLGWAEAEFVFCFPNDPYAAGARRQKIELDKETTDWLTGFYDAVGKKFCEEHGTCSFEEALKLKETKA